ncbi:MAG: TolC family protein [Aliarcobacter sp.]|nr:TolC family protein [Aliarcobacter sp.]
MKAIIYSSLIVSLVASVNLNALTLNEALDDALTTNPVVLERLKNYDKTIYDLKIAKSEYAPTLDLISKMGYKYNYDSPSSSSAAFSRNGYHMYQNSLVLTQNLFKGFGTKYKIEYEEARVMAAAYNYVEKTNDIAFNVVKNYLNVLKFKELHTLEKENILLTQDILNKTKKLSDGGSGLLSDVKKVDSSLQLAEFNLLTQENNLMDAQFNLGKLLGKKVNEAELTLPTFNSKLPATIDEATLYSAENNPSMIVSEYNIKTSKAALKESKSVFSPTVDFEFAYNFDRNTGDSPDHNRNYTALVVFKQNLYRGNADINNVNKNKINVMQEYETQREIKRQIVEGLQLSWSAYTMIEKQLVFLNSYKEQSKATLDLYRAEFEDGTRTLIDLLTAQDDYISSRSKIINATYDLLFAKYRVLDAMGEMVNSLFSTEAQKYYSPVNAGFEGLTNPNSLELGAIDKDKDGIEDNKDLCDNTQTGFKVDMYGCSESKVQVIENVPVTNSIKSTEKNSSVSSFLEKENGFVINLATLSSKTEVDNFIKSANLSDNSVVLGYVTQEHKKQLYKVVSNVYEDKKSAYEALSKMPAVVKENKPYLENIETVKNFYKNYN